MGSYLLPIEQSWHVRPGVLKYLCSCTFRHIGALVMIGIAALNACHFDGLGLGLAKLFDDWHGAHADFDLAPSVQGGLALTGHLHRGPDMKTDSSA